jgi:hypothetical protein
MPNPQQPSNPGPEADQEHRRRMVCWRVLRRWLFAAACLATLTGLLYAVEDWRGKRAWEKCRRELEAKGAVLDWNAYIPAPVPDEQNIFKAPKMTEWFERLPLLEGIHTAGVKMFAVTASSFPPEAAPPFTARQGSDPARRDVLVGEVEVAVPSTPSGSEHQGEVLRFEDPAAGDQAAKLLDAAVGPCAEGPSACVIVARPLDQIKPMHLAMEADAAPSVGALMGLITRSPVRQAPPGLLTNPYLQVASGGSNLFRVWLKCRVYSAADYLAWTQPAEADFDVMRQGLQRPFARIDGDYRVPYERPIPNFIRMRTVAKVLSERAQCYLLLRQPESAWHELELVRRMSHMLEAKPASDSPTLVEVMIDVAISGLYTSIIQDGLRLQVWREPELAAIQKQLGEINFIPLLNRGFIAERAATCRMFEASSSAELDRLFAFGGARHWFLDRFKDPTYLLVTFAPRGWIYQNMCAGAPQEQIMLEALDIASNQVLPGKLEGIDSEMVAFHARRSPYTFLAAAALPNFVKAAQTMALRQTLANEAFIACGLERYRLAHGQHPDALDELVPQFVEKLPHDIIGAQPLKYRRTADGRFVLYSVGWNGRDDGGVPGKTWFDEAQGDWLWDYAAK